MKERQRISKGQVARVAWLARIELSEEEMRLFTRQLNEVLDYFQKIDEIDTEGVEPTYHVFSITNVLRKDEVRPSLSVEQSLQNAPKKERGYFKAPRIM